MRRRMAFLSIKGRRGEGAEEESMSTVSRLILGAVMLVFITYLTVTLAGMFSDPGGEFRARMSVVMLGQRIEDVQKQDLKGAEASVIIQIPYEYVLIGFSGKERFTAKTSWYTKDIDVSRPMRCLMDKSCLCLYRIDIDAKTFSPVVVKCVSVDAERIVGTQNKQTYERKGFNPSVSPTPQGTRYNFFLATDNKAGTFTNVNIYKEGNALVLDTGTSVVRNAEPDSSDVESAGMP